jgi:hypothetical protein
MHGSQAEPPGVLDILVECTQRGAQVELTLRDGKKISRFRAHEVIAPLGPRMLPQRGNARVRGIIWPDRGMHRDDFIDLRDIASVRDQLLPRYTACEEFFHRHPLPPNWARLARCPAARKAA